MASARGPQKEKVDGVAHRRRRELQVVRAEEQACRSATDVLCRDMVKRRAELDMAADEYRRRKAELVERETGAHDQLALVLRNRSAAESALENVRDRVENVLKAQRTANTVRAYRLDARWRQLHGRYRGFVVDVLATGGGVQTPDAPRPSKKFGRRFYTAADHVSTRYRRESLRTSRSLHALMAGYLKEVSSGGGGAQPLADGVGTGLDSRPLRRRSSQLTLDGAKPERVLDKLRVMQEQCARIAERVRRRTTARDPDAVDGATAEGLRPQHRGHLQDTDDGGKRAARQSESLAEAHQRLTVGHEYIAEIRVLMDRAIAEVGREQRTLRKLLCKTCAVCVGKKAQLNGSNCTVVQIAGRLERACFVLFARLDRMGAGPALPQQHQQRDHVPTRAPGAVAHDVVTSCLLAVQAHRMHTVHQARDIEHRVHNFHKAVNRLLLATSVAPRTGDVNRSLRCDRAPRSGRKSSPRKQQPESVTQKPAPKKAQSQTFVSVVSSPKMISAGATATELTAAATVTILCPPSIGIIEYE